MKKRHEGVEEMPLSDFLSEEEELAIAAKIWEEIDAEEEAEAMQSATQKDRKVS